MAVFDQSHTSFAVPVRPTDRLELGVDLEERTVPTDECALQPRRQTTFRREHREERPSGHTGLDCLHPFQNVGDPSHMILRGSSLACLRRSLKRERAADGSACQQ